MLTAPGYNAYGVVKDIGGAFADSYAIVDITAATTGRFTFAHEITHLYGGRHNTDPDPGNAHGAVFRTGDVLGFFGTKRYTLMAVGGDSRIEHVSNPDVKYKKKATGNTNHNNAQKVNDLKYHIASFYPEPPKSFQASASVYYYLNSCQSEGVVKAAVQCGLGPYQYQWYSSQDGYNWMPKGTSSAEPFSVPANSANRKFYFMKVVVTDANNHTVTSKVSFRYFCIAPPDPDLNRRAQTLQQNPIAENISIFPNPNSGKFTITLPESVTGFTNILLKDLSGKTVVNLYEGAIDEKTKQLNLDSKNRHLRGLYLLQIETAGITLHRKIMLE
ncbi:T9SS type A sorting domain-containing protein [Adhaeribacter terrigena]|uniref:T9SS type A sorting domain-containing protein n=1 Tax=Adhaeribacter terrigena TaxID=2793070 RepID=UPI00190D402E|nr:T9SS type A sorting domain-containing protein [Adhaeribacter terrigena]